MVIGSCFKSLVKNTSGGRLSRRIRSIVLAAVLLVTPLLPLVKVHASGPAPFTHEVIDSIQVANGHKPKAIADINGDGKNDIIAYTLNDGLYWYQYPTWTKHKINSGGGGEQAQSVDIDGDGDMDVVTGGIGLSARWYENPGPAQVNNLWTERVIGSSQSHDLETGDFSGDGKADIATQDGIFIQSTPTTWTQIDNSHFPNRKGQGTSLGDVDGDGRLDLVDSSTTGQLVWYKNPLPGNPLTSTWTQRVITNSGFTESSIRVSDINKDGKADVLLANEYGAGGLQWFQGPANPLTDTWASYMIDSNVSAVHQSSIMIAYFDGDTNPDVAIAEQEQSHDPANGPYTFNNDNIKVFYNTNGTGLSMTTQVLATTGGHNAKVGDIDNDGDPDILSANHGYFGAPNPVEIWRNLRITGNQPPATAITSPTNGASFTPGANITINATASDSDGTVSKVEFFQGTTKLGENLSSPYGYTWNNVPAGNYSLTTKATDNLGAVTTSTAVNITVAAAGSTITDDFTSTTLDPAWSFVDPVGNSNYSLSTSPGHLQLNLPAGSAHDCWQGGNPTCTRMMRPAANTDGTYETKIDGNSISQQYQSYGILLWQDSTNFIRFELGTDPALKTGAWKVIGNTGSNAIAQQAYTLSASNYIRVTRVGSTFTMFTSPDGTIWTNRGAVTQAGFIVNQAGVHVGNSTAATTANFDYFKLPGAGAPDTQAPTVPTNLTTTSVTSSQVNLTWTASTDIGGSGLVGYKIFRGGTQIGTANSSSFGDGTVAANTTYSYTVSAYDAAGNNSTQSSPPLSVTTPAPPAGNITDDFTTTTLDPAWTFVDPVGNASYSLSANPGHLQLNVPSGSVHDCWSGGNPNCTRMMRSVPSTDGTYETKIDGAAISQQYQSYGILLWQDSTNFIRFEYWTDGNGVKTAAWKVIGNTGSNAIATQGVTMGAANYLRVVKSGSTYTMLSSQDGTTWSNRGSVTQAGFTVNQVGLEAGNAFSTTTQANFDYFKRF